MVLLDDKSRISFRSSSSCPLQLLKSVCNLLSMCVQLPENRQLPPLQSARAPRKRSWCRVMGGQGFNELGEEVGEVEFPQQQQSEAAGTAAGECQHKIVTKFPPPLPPPPMKTRNSETFFFQLFPPRPDFLAKETKILCKRQREESDGDSRKSGENVSYRVHGW